MPPVAGRLPGTHVATPVPGALDPDRVQRGRQKGADLTDRQDQQEGDREDKVSGH